MRFSAFRTASLSLMVLFAMAMCPEQVWLGSPAKVVAQNRMPDLDDPFGDLTPAASRKSSSNTTLDKDKTALKNAESQLATSPSPSNSTLADDEVRQKLYTPCNFDLDETSFVDVKEQLENDLGVNIVLTSSASDDALTEDETFTSDLSGITHASALRILLAAKNATYCVQDGVLKIISLDEASDQQWCVRRMTDVSETLALIRVAERDRIGKPKSGKPKSGETIVIPKNGGGGVFRIQGVYGGGSKGSDQADGAKDIQKLAAAIVQAVENSQAKAQRPVVFVTAESILIDTIKEIVDNDGFTTGGWSIACVGGILVVKSPEDVSENVDSFVKDLHYRLKAAAEKRR